jgi:hypothetical protein
MMRKFPNQDLGWRDVRILNEECPWRKQGTSSRFRVMLSVEQGGQHSYYLCH